MNNQHDPKEGQQEEQVQNQATDTQATETKAELAAEENEEGEGDLVD